MMERQRGGDVRERLEVDEMSETQSLFCILEKRPNISDNLKHYFPQDISNGLLNLNQPFPSSESGYTVL